MSKITDLLPNGSVVSVEGCSKKLMTFGVKQSGDETGQTFDYIAVIYPEGNIGEGGQFLFNHSDIEKVFHRGYSDDEREEFMKNINDFYSKENA